jgi:hypothetical protein
MVAVLFLAACAGQGLWAQDRSKAAVPYPEKDNYQAYVKYVRDLQAFYNSDADKQDVFAWEPFSDLVKAGRDEGAFQLAKAMRDTISDGSYAVNSEAFTNPVNLAYKAGRFDLVKRLIGMDSRLAGMHDDYDESQGLTPLATAVANDDIKWAQAFLDAGADLNTEYVEGKKGGGGYPANLFTISKSKAMDDFLAGKKLKTLFVLESPAEGSCNDDNVRMRSEPGTQGAVLAKLMKGEKISVLAVTFKRDTVGDCTSCWVKVSCKGQIGWVFQEFVQCDCFDMP